MDTQEALEGVCLPGLLGLGLAACPNVCTWDIRVISIFLGCLGQ